MRGILGGVAGGGLPAIGARLFTWSADGEFGTTWADSDLTIPAAIGGRVGGIKSSQGGGLAQAFTTQRPLLVGNSQNGLPGLYFSRSRGDFLQNLLPSFLAPMQAQTALTLMLVWNPTTASGTHAGLCWHASGSSRRGIYCSRAPTDHFAGREGSTVSLPEYNSTVSTAFATVMTFDGFGGNPKQNKIFVQNTSHVAAAYTSPVDDGNAWDSATIGGRRNSSGITDNLEGTLYEIVLFDTAADLTGVGDLFTYANAKWALP